jgi:glycosyltransferase involved in cell wall biosynthesis
VSELKAAIEHLNLESSVGLTGFVVDSAAALRSLDIVVHTSTAKEPFGLVIAEAMACGRPVVVTNSGGVAELVQPDVNALTYEAGNPTGLSIQIERLLRDDVLRHRLGDAARSAAMDQFKPSMMESRLLTVYGTFGRKEAA